ncbi:hypothetical protein ACFL5O_01760 [Myxococcota bacterium]
MRAVVVGAGVAGTAAAWAIARSGGEAILVHDRPGATELYSGALDGEPSRSDVSLSLETDLHAWVRSLEIWALPRNDARVATGAGITKRSRGLDHTLLNLEPLAGNSIAVLSTDYPAYDGKLLARTLADSQWAESTKTHFTAVAVDVVHEASERSCSPHDFAVLHDSPERIEWLAEQLRSASSSYDAWLLGPWLGLEPETVLHLRQALERPVGETTSLPGGAAGARFARARDRLMRHLGLTVVRGRVLAATRTGKSWKLDVESYLPNRSRTGGLGGMGGRIIHPEAGWQKTAQVLEADAVVLACGGIVSGGIELAPVGSMGPAFRLSFGAPIALTVHQAVLRPMSTLHGPVLDRLGPEVFESVGIATRGPHVQGEPGLVVAGAALARQPHTMLHAAQSGLVAARAVLETWRPGQ